LEKNFLVLLIFLFHKIFYSHNFGHNGALSFHGLGINGKISELQAAMGLAVLPYMGEILEGRKKVIDQYDRELNFSRIQKIKIRDQTDWNYSYYPIVFESEEKMLDVEHRLNEQKVVPRRYFNPSLNTIQYVNGDSTKNSESIASRVLCLPLYTSLNKDKVHVISMSF
jgi:dTDP-4-amino-4,6-dideoxygalactose transaminase